MEQSDHDLLITIDTKVTMIHDQFSKHVEDDIVSFTDVKRDVKASHGRLDRFQIWMFGALVVFLCAAITVIWSGMQT